VASDPLRARKIGHWTEDDTLDLELDEVDVPEQPYWRRCGAVHCIERGPWAGTLVCCMRKSDHENEHLMILGDVGSPEYWQEFWL
jgi:hypothetical protein